VGISADTQKDHANLVARYRLAYPMLSDPGVKTAFAYGVAMDGRDIAIPSLFVLDRNGTVVWRYVGETMADRPHSARITEVLTELRKKRKAGAAATR